jgi:hypothetical protein
MHPRDSLKVPGGKKDTQKQMLSLWAELTVLQVCLRGEESVSHLWDVESSG